MAAVLRTMATLARLAGRGVFSARRQEAPEPRGGTAFEVAFKALACHPSVAPEIRQARVLTLSADEAGWTPAGFEVKPGEEVTVFAAGGFIASKALDLRFGARIGVWLRAGDQGHIRKTGGAAATLRMSEGGPLHVVAKPPGEWADERGAFDPAFPRGGLAGVLSVCVIVWKESALKGLDVMARAGDHEALVAEALEDARHPVEAPEGWRYLWRLGEGRIYREASDGDQRRICCHTHEDVGILQFPADFALTDTTRLRWRWKADRLPCDLPEDIQPTHDYLSIAVEFENGQDLTYMWSSKLAVGTIFRCPLPYWDRVETHWVLRSDARQLGQWLSEERPVKADYARAVGAPPARIVRVWLIAVSVFQRGTGICEYADIELVDGDRVIKVL